nr:hypothetical protein [Hyphomicrobium zavarzinii]
MMPLAARDVPFHRLDQASVNRARQQISDALEPDRLILAVLGIGRLALEETLHLALGLEAP